MRCLARVFVQSARQGGFLLPTVRHPRRYERKGRSRPGSRRPDTVYVLRRRDRSWYEARRGLGRMFHFISTSPEFPYPYTISADSRLGI
jgi:hypothetical protein